MLQSAVLPMAGGNFLQRKASGHVHNDLVSSQPSAPPSVPPHITSFLHGTQHDVRPWTRQVWSVVDAGDSAVLISVLPRALAHVHDGLRVVSK